MRTLARLAAWLAEFRTREHHEIELVLMVVVVLGLVGLVTGVGRPS